MLTTKQFAQKGRGKSAKSLALVDAAHAILSDIQPASVRAVCYRLFVAGVIRDMSKASTQRVSEQLVYARENRIIPWAWIVDETREAERQNLWDDPSEILDAAVRSYRKDYWLDQPEWVEVWSEKGTVRGTLAPVLHKFGVTFRVMHGYGSATAINAVAEETRRSEQPMTILYVGDHDPSGLHMALEDLPKRLFRYGANATIHRLAVTADDGRDLPSFDAASKVNDARYKWYMERFGPRCWELDALPPPVLRDRVAEAINGLLDVDAWNHAVVVEDAEIESMAQFMRQYRASISGQGGNCSASGGLKGGVR